LIINKILNVMKKNTIVITGCFGHIGSKLVTSLCKKIKNKKFIIIDNLNYASIKNIKQFTQFKKFIEFKNIDLSKKFDEKIFKNTQLVIHLAAFTSQEESFSRPMDFKKNNFGSTLNIVKVCKKYSIPLIYPSSTSIYGSANTKNLLIKQANTINLKPTTPYAKLKLKEEILIKNTLNNYKILRLATIVGHSNGMKFHTAVNKFCYQILLDEKITIWKTAINQKRPYLTLEQFCKTIIEILKFPKKYKEKIYNLVTSNYSVNEILQILEKFKHVKIKIVKSKSMNNLNLQVINNIGFTKKNDIENSIKEILEKLSLKKINKNNR